MLFALLEHNQTLGVHWDLLLQVPGSERLLTWRLTRNPLHDRGIIPVEQITPHRRHYLSYEGPIGRGRGWVRRLDRGTLLWRQLTPGQWRFVLSGARVSCMVAIDGTPRGLLRLGVTVG